MGVGGYIACVNLNTLLDPSLYTEVSRCSYCVREGTEYVMLPCLVWCANDNSR